VDVSWANQLESNLREVEDNGAEPSVAEGVREGAPETATSARARKPLVCKETEAQLTAERRWLERSLQLVYVVAVLDLLFIAAVFLVIIKFTLGDTPKSSVARIVYIIPIVGTVLGSAAVAFLLKERKAERKAVEDLNRTFQRVCRGV
jgi:hypothetical protein